MLFDIALTFFLVFLNGFFVAAEFAIVKVRLSQIELRVRIGNRFAKMAKNLVEHLDEYLSATQLGITLASLGLGWIGEDTVTHLVISTMGLFSVSIDPELAHKIALPIAFATITFLHIVFGELAPKSLAIQKAELVTMSVAYPMRLFYLVFKPFIWTLNGFANLLLRQIGIEPAKEKELHSSDEIRLLLEESSRSGVIETTEHELIENVFEFRETTANQIMVPRGRVCALEISMKSDAILELVMEEGFSRLPVYKDSIDNIVGVVYAKDLLTMISYQNLIILQDILRPAFFVQETQRISHILRLMQRNRVHLAVVLDEFGGTAGIVTMENIMEELVGDIQDEYDDEKAHVERASEREWVLNASAAVYNVNEMLPIALPESDAYETIGGLVSYSAGRIPDAQETIALDHYDVLILERSPRAIASIRLSLRDQMEATAPQESDQRE